MTELKDDLTKMKAYLEDLNLSPGDSGLTAELVDEEDPEGIVIIKRADGTIAASMRRQEYEDLKEWQPTHLKK